MRIIIPCHILAKALNAVSRRKGRIDSFPPCFCRYLQLCFANDLPHPCKREVIYELLRLRFLMHHDDQCMRLVRENMDISHDTFHRAKNGDIITQYEKLNILGELR